MRRPVIAVDWAMMSADPSGEDASGGSYVSSKNILDINMTKKKDLTKNSQLARTRLNWDRLNWDQLNGDPTELSKKQNLSQFSPPKKVWKFLIHHLIISYFSVRFSNSNRQSILGIQMIQAQSLIII